VVRILNTVFYTLFRLEPQDRFPYNNKNKADYARERNSMRQKRLRWFVNLPLKKKILGIVIVVNILLITVASVVGMKFVVNSSEKLLGQTMAHSLSYSSTKIADTLDTAKSLSNIIFSNDTIQNELLVIKTSEDSLDRMSAYQQLFSSIQAYYTEYRKYPIRYISLLNDSFTTNSDDTVAAKTPGEVTDLLVSRALARDGAMAFETDYCEQYGLFVTRSVREIAHFSMQTLGTLLICLDLDEIVSRATDFGSTYQEAFYILLDQDRVIYHSPALSADSTQDAQAQLTDTYGIVELDRHRYFAVKGSVTGYGWESICMVSYDANYHQLLFSYWLFVGMIGLATLVAILLSNWLINSLSRHFNALIVKMQSFRGHKEEIPGDEYDYRGRTDEIGLLHQQFNGMAEEINTLIQENYTQELLAKDSQLRALETQINPHFLYNILESINWHARAIKANEISAMVEALGHFLRITLDKSRKLFTLSEEMDLVHYYITIQQIRFQDQLQYEETIDPDVLSASVPKMVVQPLVENAVRYAVESSLDLCRISVIISRAGDDLQIDVENSGSQFESDLLEKLQNAQIAPHGFGIGLINIQERLQLTFGRQYGLTLFNRNGCAVARITIPFRPYENKGV